MTMLTIYEIDGDRHAIDERGEWVGAIAAADAGDPGVFARIYGGLGSIYHVEDPPPNLFFHRHWGQIFANPERLPRGTKNVLLENTREWRQKWLSAEPVEPIFGRCSEEVAEAWDLQPRLEPDRAAELLAECLTEECPHYHRAMLLAKGCSSRNSRGIVNFYRHRCTDYDRRLKDGGDRLTLTIRYNRELMEIVTFIRSKKDEIALAPNSKWNHMEIFEKLARLDLDGIYREALRQIDGLRMAEAQER